MIAIAIGPQNTLRLSGIMARMAAAAVSTTGRARRTLASTTAVQRAAPAAMSWSIWSTRITALRMIMPPSAITPSSATKPKGAWKASRAGTTPIRPSGAVRKTMPTRRKLCSCTISTPSVTRNISGKTAKSARLDLSLSSLAPPISRR